MQNLPKTSDTQHRMVMTAPQTCINTFFPRIDNDNDNLTILHSNNCIQFIYLSLLQQPHQNSNITLSRISQFPLLLTLTS